MAKYNATFKYRLRKELCQDDDGFWSNNDDNTWILGGYCYVEKHIPPKEVKGIDGTLTIYTYEIFLPKEVNMLRMTTGAQLIITINGYDQEVVVAGVDDTGKKHIVLWA